MYTIATLYRLRQRLGFSDTDTAEDARLLAALGAATAQIEQAAGRRFIPRKATLTHTITDATELLLEDDLLELTAVTDGDGSSVDVGDVLLRPVEGATGVLQRVDGGGFTWVKSPVQAVSVTGIWGYHDRWPEAWRATGDSVQDNPLIAGAATLKVNDADGTDADGESPRFQVGQLLQVGTEYVWVLAVAGNTLTIQRGANGTIAAEYAQSTPIAAYRPPLDVEMLCLRWAAWLYKEPDNRVVASTPNSLSAGLGGLRRLGVKV